MLILVPVLSLIVYAVWRYLKGKPLRKYDLNILSSFVLLLYFLATAGTGIFWVANQELPVFDLHYLVGYITLLLIIVHVAFNWKAISVFLRRRAPAVALTADARSWRPVVRGFAWVLALGLFGFVCFWIGLRQGSSQVEISQVVQSYLPPVDSAVKNTRQALPRQMIKSDGKESPLAVYYHDKTKHSRTSILTKSGGLDWSTQPSVFKNYPDAKTVTLSDEILENSTSTGDAIDFRRQQLFSLKPKQMSFQEFSTLLHMTNGVTAIKKFPSKSYFLRSAPSAGALYPTVTYVLVNNVEGVEPGLYHYDVKNHIINLLRSGPELVEELAQASSSSDLVQNSSLVFLFSSIYFRSSWKYGERSYRYCLLDAGHVAENMMLAAAAMGYSSLPIGRFDDQAVNKFLAIDEQTEGAMILVPVGQATTQAASTTEPAFVTNPQQIDGDGNQLLLLSHGQTYLKVSDGAPVEKFPVRKWQDKPYAGLPIIKLPKEFAKGDLLFPTIQKRRSSRNWYDESMTLEQLSSVLYHSFGIKDRQGTPISDPSVESTQLLNLYLMVFDVQGLDAGVYYYRRNEHALTFIKAADDDFSGYEISIFQDAVGNSGVALIKTIDTKFLGYPDGDRGYRYATMEAGMIGGRLYLQTIALGLGCTGIGAFFDNEVSTVIGVDPQAEMIIYMSAIGIGAPD